MKIETLQKSHLKRNIILGVVTILIISAVILNFTKAKYRTTQSIPLVNGTINYTPYDFKVMAMYQENDNGEYVEIDTMPSSGYMINENESYCTIDNVNHDEEAILYTNDDGEHVIGNLKKNSKCYLYFDEYAGSVRDVLLANYPTQLTRSSFTSTVTNTTTGTIYYADTSKGRTYYFAGNPTDNWVSFGGFYWRIIRINEDGTIRMIYQGTSNNATGTGTQLQTSAFNSSYNNNAYVGLKYTTNNVHGTGTNSTVLGVLNTWYQNNLASYVDDLDGNAGFCGDRSPSTSSSSINNSGGTGTTQTYYGGYVRLYGNTSLTPTFECANDSDLYTTSGSSDGNRALQYPIGLISMDEAWYAGGYSSNNTSYYLYTGQAYWTLSPCYYNSSFTYPARVFLVSLYGLLTVDWVDGTNGVRPVINLKADVQISSGSGTSSNPYVIS